MKELRIEEQKSICGGTYSFVDYSTGITWTGTDYFYVYNKRQVMLSLHHSVSDIEAR